MDIIYNNESGLAVRNKLNGNFTELKSLIDDMKGALVPQGNWDASTNTPDISAETETGYYWIVSADGSTDIGGITDWKTNDWAIKTASGWAKIDNTDNEKADITYVDAADLALQNNINAEATARNTADGTLQDNIDAEATARGNADNALQNNIDNNSNLISDLANNVLQKGNIIPFTPTLDNEPATKKYVDDNSSTISGITGNFTVKNSANVVYNVSIQNGLIVWWNTSLSPY